MQSVDIAIDGIISFFMSMGIPFKGLYCNKINIAISIAISVPVSKKLFFETFCHLYLRVLSADVPECHNAYQFRLQDSRASCRLMDLA